MKLNTLIIACLLLSLSCTKEGLPGPQGPEGPAGEPGSGGSGGQTTIITFLTPTTVTYSWEQVNVTSTNITFRFKWAKPTNSDYVFKLPDSLTTIIDSGALLVYAFQANSTDPLKNKWYQLDYTPAGFTHLETYTYQTEKVNGQYTIKILADMLKRTSTMVRVPMIITRLKFVIIPKTDTKELEWG